MAAKTLDRRRGVQLHQVNSHAGDDDEPEKGIDIIAVHGLDTGSPETWQYKTKDGRKVNWLQDEHMLPSEVSNARIFTCDWPAELFETLDAEADTIQELALRLLAGIQARPSATNKRLSHKDRPILFIASCLGGIILAKALVMAKNEYQPVQNATRGIIFLATPFRGTSFEDVARWAEPGLRTWASIRGRRVASLLSWVKSSKFDLTLLVNEFTQLCDNKNHDGYKVLTFYEAGYTDLRAKVPLLSCLLPRSKKQLVSKSSAVLDCVPNPLRLERTHILMNKFCGPNDPDYKLVVDKVLDFLEDIRKGTPLEQADAWIRKEHYNKKRLNIERISGKLLPMGQCYINLALVETPREDNSEQRSKDNSLQSSPFSLASRLKVETPHENLQVELSKLFEPRKQTDDRMKEPRRILIRGRAGVGKTTLCKKIVHDFIEKVMWRHLFARVLWVPLRNLKTWHDANYSLTDMLRHIYLQQCPERDSLASALQQNVDDSTPRSTLFILDGLDEVTELLDKQLNPSMSDFLVGLLNQTNVIITTRPHVSLPHDFQKPDLELETIGFRSDQVEDYLKAVTTPMVFKKIQSYLQRSPLMQSLVRIPIQLDALCIVWDETLEDSHRLNTMTQVYQAIVKRLWKKDIKRLKESQTHVEALSSSEIEDHTENEIQILESLAFSGICSNLIEFQSAHRNAIHKLVRSKQPSLPVYETLGRLSFLRTSDGSADTDTRTHHFIHLTFQEYFAARYFVRMWTNQTKLKYVALNRQNKSYCAIAPKEFLGRNKYTGRYDIMWRFVAGLLSEEGEDETTRFFEEIEKEPIDVLGPVHQRLVMHCLNEAPDLPSGLREQSDKRLLQWVLFERDFTGSSTFTIASELPEEVLQSALTTSGKKKVLLDGLIYTQRHLSDTTMAALVGLFKDEDNHVRESAAQALGNQSTLSDTTIAALMGLFKDEDRYIRRSAAEAIGKQSTLSDTTITALIELFEDENNNTRESAAEAIGKQSTLSDTTIAALVELFKDEDRYVRESAVKALGKQSTLSDTTMAAIVGLFKDENNNARESTAKAIGKQSTLSDTTITALIELFEDENNNARESAAEAIGKQSTLSDTTIAALVGLFKDEDNHVRESAAEAIGKQSTLSDTTIAALVELFKDEDSYVRRYTAKAVGNQSTLSDTTIAALVGLFKDEDNHVRYSAAEAIGKQSTLSDTTIAALVDLFKDENWNVRYSAAKAIGNQSTLSDTTIAALVEHLGDEDNHVRESAAQALGNQSTLSDTTIAALVGLFKDEEKDVRRSAAYALGNQSTLSDTTIAALVGLCEDEYIYIRRPALEALGKQSTLSDTTTAALVGLCKDEDRYVRESAVKALGKQSTLSDTTITALMELFKNDDSNVRYSAAKAIGKQSTLSDTTIAALIELFKDQDRYVRKSAVKALGNQSTLSDTTMAALVGLFKDENWNVRFSAVKALGKQSTLSDTTIAALMELFKNEDSDVRRPAVEAIGNQSTLSDTTITALMGLFKDEDRYVRRSAAEAIGKQSTLSDTTMVALVDLFKDENWSVRRSAAQALGKQSTFSDTTMAALVELLKDEDSYIQRSAAEALGNQSTLSDTTMAALVGLFKNENSYVRQSAAEAIGNQSTLSDKILDALGLPVQLEEHTQSVPRSFRRSGDVESFYESFLHRSFNEHFSLYADGDFCIVNQGSGLRMTTMKDQTQFQMAVKRGRHKLEKSDSYCLWSIPNE